MESLYAGLLVVAVLTNIALALTIRAYRRDIAEMNDARREWWDAYKGALDENTRIRAALTAMRAAHDELQEAFTDAVLSDTPSSGDMWRNPAWGLNKHH